MTNFEWGPAAVTHPDWQGTMQIDEKTTGEESIYSLTGIDKNEWTIVGLDWGGGETGWHELNVIVVPQGTDLSEPELDATHLKIHDSDPMEILTKIMHVADYRLRIRSVVDSNIRITALGDVPEQDA